MDTTRNLSGLIAETMRALVDATGVGQIRLGRAIGMGQPRVSKLLNQHDGAQIRAAELARMERALGLEPGAVFEIVFGADFVDALEGRSPIAGQLLDALFDAEAQIKTLTRAAKTTPPSDLPALQETIEHLQRRATAVEMALHAYVEGGEVDHAMAADGDLDPTGDPGGPTTNRPSPADGGPDPTKFGDDPGPEWGA